MKRCATFAAAAAFMAAGSAAFAQGADGFDRPGPRREPLSRAELESLVDARVAAIQAGLKLTAEQQRHWPAVETALRDAAAQRIAGFEERREAWARARAEGRRPRQEGDFMERLERRSQRVDARAERVKALSDAVKPLWASLDERQKRILPVLMRPAMGGGRGRHHGGHHGPERGPRR